MALDLTALSALLRRRFQEEHAHLRDLLQADISSGEKKNAALVERMADNFTETLSRMRSEQSRGEAIRLAEAFSNFGAKAILKTGSQRGGDFLNNQIRGRWAEDVVTSMRLRDTVIIPFGPSGAAMPGEEDHRKMVMTFKEITLVEGKRPDLLAYDAGEWARLAAREQDRTRTWPHRTLEADDNLLVKRAIFGIEVKNSTWHYEKRRAAGGGPLSITVKAEETDAIDAWQGKTGRPVLFFQVLFDEVYCMSFRRMLDAIRRGRVYQAGDYQLDESTGADGKTYHRFHLDNLDHKCANVAFPSESLAHVRVLPDGSVIPYIELRPARATGEIHEVVERELRFPATT